jgi:hypothetical protein
MRNKESVADLTLLGSDILTELTHKLIKNELPVEFGGNKTMTLLWATQTCRKFILGTTFNRSKQY